MMKLYTYFRSSASYRIRIALHLKGLNADHVPVHLVKGEQVGADYLAKTPQGLVPALRRRANAVLVICSRLLTAC